MHHLTTFDLIMCRSTDRIMSHVDPFAAPHAAGGIAPLRHEVALARYLEKQAAHRAAAARPVIGPAMIALCAWLARNLPVFHGSGGAIQTQRPLLR